MKTQEEHPTMGTEGRAINKSTFLPEKYEYPETRELVQLVEEAAALIEFKGEAAFVDFRLPDSRWNKGEQYLFVLDPRGNMLVHPDPDLEGKNQMGLKDIDGKPIVKGLLEAVTTLPDMQEGWYHYQWPVPGGLLPRWKSSFAKLAKTASGKSYVVGSGMYNDRMERAFVEDTVKHAVGEIEKSGRAAFKRFYDPTGPFLVKDAYVFVADMHGIELVDPAFPSIEGRKLLDLKDSNGKFVYREMIHMIYSQEAGWLDFLWPRPGDSVPTRKSAYVHAAHLEGHLVMVGCGVYLSNAPRELRHSSAMTAAALKKLVHEAADLLQERGELAYSFFRVKGSKWFRNDTYPFVFTMNGTRAFHAAEPESEGRNDSELRDVVGRPMVKMMLETGATPLGEGWVHYMYPEPGGLFPTWKSSYVKRVTYPSGEQHIVGFGVYNMQMDKAFVEDVVNHAAALLAGHGKAAFPILRDKTGPFFFMDTYVFVQSPDGTELVNPMHPSLEGKNLLDLKDLQGKAVVRDEIEAALTEGSAWLECYWYLPGNNTPALKQTFVRKAKHNDTMYIVGSGIYGCEGPAAQAKNHSIRKTSWDDIKKEKLSDKVTRQALFGEKGTLAKFTAKKGVSVARHYHDNEEYLWVLSGAGKVIFDDKEVALNTGEMIVIPPNVPHALQALEDTVFIDFFAPVREDWLRGHDQYLRKNV